MQVVPGNQKALNPGKELSKEKMEAIATFLPLMKQKRLELRDTLRQDQTQETQFLLKMVSMFLFHSHLVILKSDQKRQEVKDFFVRLLKTESSLPVPFCIDVLTKYLMFDEALLFLFYRKDY